MASLDAREGAAYIFVGGSPRSGTTLVQNILDSHPEIAGGPEFDHIPTIMGLRREMLFTQATGRLDAYKLNVDVAMADLVNSLLLPYLHRRDRRYLSEKSPSNVLVFDQLLQVFPRSRCIFVVRDPRAVVASILEVGRRAKERGVVAPAYTSSVVSAIELVREHVAAGLSVLPDDRVCAVAYEHLVTQPAQATRDLCEFLAVDWHPEMLSPSASQHEGVSTVDDVWYTRSMYESDPHQRSLRSWETALRPWQRLLVDAAFASQDMLKSRFGYDFDQRRGFMSSVVQSRRFARAVSSATSSKGLARKAIRHLRAAPADSLTDHQPGGRRGRR